jgi:hypothetical protein
MVGYDANVAGHAAIEVRLVEVEVDW